MVSARAKDEPELRMDARGTKGHRSNPVSRYPRKPGLRPQCRLVERKDAPDHESAGVHVTVLRKVNGACDRHVDSRLQVRGLRGGEHLRLQTDAVRQLHHMGFLAEGLGPERISMQAHGYKEIMGYLLGRYDRDEAIRLLKRNTRRYVKYQLIWLRGEPNVHWVDATRPADEVAEACRRLIVSA